MSELPHIPANPSAIARRRIDIVKETIHLIEAYDLEAVSIDDLKLILNRIIVDYRISAPAPRPGLMVYRCRVTDHKPTLFKEIVRPPEHLVATEQRVNRRNQSFFYCSILPTSAIIETSPAVGQHISIGKWITKKRMVLNHTGFHETAMSNIGSQRDSETWQKQPKEQSEATKLVYEFFSKSFVARNPKNHNLTIAIAEILIENEIFDALLYPSIAYNGHADNLAIKPRFADLNLEFINVQYGVVTEVNKSEDFFKINFSDFANSVDTLGNLEWKGRRGEWNSRHQYDSIQVVSIGDGFWNATDAEGNPREMD
jgi:hypothetical protein